MIYYLKHFDTPIIKFSASESSSSPEAEILWVNPDSGHLLPLDLELRSYSLNSWLKRRTIPANRAYVHAFLAKSGLSINRPMNIIRVSKGLSLNDCYWITEEGFQGEFRKYNLYDNRFSQILGLIAFTGYGTHQRASLASCPEFTTNGMLPKCWRRTGSSIKLYKGGTSGYSNTGMEPYSEFYASQLAQTMGISAVDYTLSRWNGSLCSVCELFTSKAYSFMPVGRIVTEGGMEAVHKYYESLGERFTNALDDMLIFDAVICNTDRHYGNFGFLVDNASNTIVSPAPLFDHGNSLFNFASEADMESRASLEKYINTLMPCNYDDFIGTAKSVLKPRHREMLRHMVDFKFKKHSRYNLPHKRLITLEGEVRRRVRLILE